MNQTLYSGVDCLDKLNDIIDNLGIRRLLFVHGKSFYSLPVKDSVDLKIYNKEFTDFSPNPDMEEVRCGLDVFESENCNGILAIGGGSAIDVSKGIKYLSKKNVPIIAVPTTAGSGSEATRFAVVYENGVKQSLRDDSFIPNVVFLDSRCLFTLPSYQRKSAMLDALCQAIESIWSVNSNDESKAYANKAIELICENYRAYIFDNDIGSYDGIMNASNLSGKAINITQTTAAHACAYKITTLYGFAHGHAVACCITYIWEYMINHMERCSDKRGRDYLWSVFEQIAAKLGAISPMDGVYRLRKMLVELNMELPETDNPDDYDKLVDAVNVLRLGNNPVELDKTALREIYDSVVRLKRG